MCLRAEEGQFFFLLEMDYHNISVSFFAGSIWASGGREAGNLVAAFVTDRYPFTERWLLFVSHFVSRLFRGIQLNISHGLMGRTLRGTPASSIRSAGYAASQRACVLCVAPRVKFVCDPILDRWDRPCGVFALRSPLRQGRQRACACFEILSREPGADGELWTMSCFCPDLP